jgi:electron transfer flavoprotein beta subunit
VKIVACFKVTPEAQDITSKPDGSLSFDRAAWKAGAYDLNAIEAARELADATGGAVVGLSVGGAALGAAKIRKDVASRGLDELVLFADDAFAGADAYQTAGLLKAALEEIGDYDLVLLGAGSSDVYAQQVGNELGALLGAPTLNAVSKIAAEPGRLVVQRTLEDEVQVLEVALPAVLSVTSGINTPRIPGMKDILAAAKKPVTELDAGAAGAGEFAPTAKNLSTSVPEQAERQLVILEGETADVVSQLAAYLSTTL